ncbi:MAG: flagellar biosynthesis anti-sigma factor FlgM [Ruminococcaceae bacterium]|nr:flagellar biosynthesis anti-sigma factor FlgM [Oscillospiraceae bacterium]
MEIKNISGILNTYNKVKMSGSKVKTAPTTAKTDKVEFNFARSVEAAKSNLAAQISSDAAAEKISSLSESVENGSYQVDPEALVDAILMF